MSKKLTVAQEKKRVVEIRIAWLDGYQTGLDTTKEMVRFLIWMLDEKNVKAVHQRTQDLIKKYSMNKASRGFTKYETEAISMFHSMDKASKGFTKYETEVISMFHLKPSAFKPTITLKKPTPAQALRNNKRRRR